MKEENCATELYKAYGDYLFSGKNFEEAKEVYDYVLENSRNGLFWLDIQAKTGQTTGVMYEDSFSPSPIELKEQELLSEIHNLCRRKQYFICFKRALGKKTNSQRQFGLWQQSEDDLYECRECNQIY